MKRALPSGPGMGRGGLDDMTRQQNLTPPVVVMRLLTLPVAAELNAK